MALDLDREYLRCVHLLVQELDDRSEARGDVIRHEDEAEPLRAQVCLHPRPVVVVVGVRHMSKRLSWIEWRVRGFAPRLELRPHPLWRPEREDVRRVVEHLPDDLAADPSVGGALDLHKRRDALAVEEDVVGEPAVRASFSLRHSRFTLDEEVSGQSAHGSGFTEHQLGMSLDERL